MIAVVRIDSISGDSSLANQASTHERDDADPVRELQEAAKAVLEQDRPEQKQQGTADRAHHRLEIGMPARMFQHEFVGHRRDDDAGDDRHVQIGIGEPRQPSRLARS